ncbi:MAG TPA: MFS transporter, partial [Vicinamibacterales bacterium]|nr:MFS transporter [Vicinamibacterales bacterium]
MSAHGESHSIDIGQVIDSCPIRALHYGIFALCALCMVMDGFDLQALGYVAPVVVSEWKIAPSLMGPVFGASNLGVLIGQLVFTVLGDKIGRRPVLITATVAFSVLTLITGSVNSVSQLLIARFVAGMALGSIIPNATALILEFSPRTERIRLVTYAGVGFVAGSVLSGLVAAWLIPLFGWRAVFYVGGVAPLFVAAMMYLWLPESLVLLVLQKRRFDYVARWLGKLRPDGSFTRDSIFVAREERVRGVPVIALLRQGRLAATLLLWLVFFLNLFNLYSLANWLPIVVRGAGYPTGTAVLVGTTLQLGGMVTPFFMAWAVMRKGFVPVLTIAFVLATGSIVLIGQPGLALSSLVLAVFVAGGCVVGSQPTLNTLAATFYPTSLRSTGLGWALGVGRVGSIVGPVIAGELIAWRWATRDIFLALAIPALISAVVVAALPFVIKPGPAGTDSPATPHLGS